MRTKRANVLIATFGVALIGGAALLTTLLASAPAFSAGGAVAGTVTYSGTVTPVKVKVTKNPEVCGKKPIPYEEVIVGAGGALKNTVVSLVGAPKPATLPKKELVLDQIGCVYVPHVAAMTKGNYMILTSTDPILHNVHGYLNDRTIFNIGLPVAGMKVKKKVKKAGHLKVVCDAGHTWMIAHIMVFDHPYYAVTDAKGAFRIDGVPAGTYSVKVWHEKLGEKTATATVAATGAATVNVAY